MDGLEKFLTHGSARPLRVINMLAFIPGIILLLITGLATKAGLFNLIAVAPLTLSALLGLVSVARKDKRMPWTMYADLCLTMFFVSVLVPMYVRFGHASRTSFDSLTICNYFSLITLAAYTDFWDVSEVLLCAYGTMPLIVDLYVSCCSNCGFPFDDLVKSWSICMHMLQLALEPG